MADLVPYIASVLVVVGALVLLGLRRRILLRLGVRNFLRRRGQVALAVAGLFVGTSIISGALVMGDSFDFTVRDLVFREFHLVDEVVWARNDTGTRTHESLLESPKGFFPETAFAELRDRLAAMPHVDGLAPRILTAASVSDGDTGFVEPSSRLIAFDPDRDFDAFLRGGAPYDGADLGPQEALLNERLAEHLEAREGHTVTVFTELGSTNLRVRAIVDDEGKGGFFGQPNLFLRLSEAQAFLNVSGLVNAIFVSNVGGVAEGHDATEDAVAELAAALPSVPGIALRIAQVKAQALDERESSISWVTLIFVSLGMFTIIAGVLLIINIFVVLAEERKGEMGISRALGMRRAHLTETFVFEGLLYALAASAIGAIAGLAFAGSLILVLSLLIGDSGRGFFFAPSFHFETESLVIAFAVGFLATMAVVTLASWRVSRLNIVRAIRSIPEPVVRKGTRRQWVLSAILGAFGALATWQAVVLESPTLVAAGPALLAFGLAGVARRGVGTRAAYTIAAFAVMGWILYPPRLGWYAREAFAIEAFVTGGIVLILSGVVVVVLNDGALLALLTRLAGRRRKLRPVLKTAISYPMARRGRTALSLAMFALVLFTITVISMWGALFLGDVEQFVQDQTGGYDIGGRAYLLPPGRDFAADFRAAPVYPKIAYYSAFNGSVATIWNRTAQPLPYPVYGIPPGFAAQNEFPFAELSPDYATGEAAWEALAADGNLTIVGGGFASGFGPFALSVGNRLEVANARGDRHPLTVIGILREFFNPGLFVGEATAGDAFFARSPVAFLFEVNLGESPSVVERELERDLTAWGVDATVFREQIDQVLAFQLSFLRFLQSYLALGLVVGVAGLGVVTMRNVSERRNEIGTLRAVGFRRSMILKYLLIENSFVSLLGIVLGMGLGIAVAYDVFVQFFASSGADFRVPWFDLVAIAAVAYAAGLVSTIPPSRKAARMPPAQALRIVE